MVTGEVNAQAEVKQEEIPAQPPAPAAQTTPAPDINALIAKAKQEALEEARKESQRAMAKRDRELAELRKQVNQPVTSSEDTGMMESALALAKKSLDSDDPEIRRLEQQLQSAKTKQVREAQLRQQQQITQQHQDRFNQFIEAAGITSDDPRLEAYHDAFEDARDMTGNFARAERKLTNILNSFKKAEVPPAPKEEVIPKSQLAKMLEDEKRKWMQEQGLLSADAGTPSASMLQADQLRAKYNAGEISAEEMLKHGVSPV